MVAYKEIFSTLLFSSKQFAFKDFLDSAEKLVP